MEGKLLQFPMDKIRKSTRQQWNDMLSTWEATHEAKQRYNEARLAQALGMTHDALQRARQAIKSSFDK